MKSFLKNRLRLGPGAGFAALGLAVVAACGSTTVPTGAEGGPGSAAVVTTRDDDGLTGTLVDDPPLHVAAVTLRNTAGAPVNLARLAADKVTILFFGFTHCDDVCPTTMADLATARRILPQDIAQRLEIRFVTVDPRRDTPAVLRAWLDQYGTDVTGLRGPSTLVNRAERSLYADASSTTAPDTTEPTPQADGHTHGHDDKPSAKAAGHDQVSHSGSVYIFGPHGETVLYTGGTTPQQYAADLTHLVRRP